MAVLVVSRGVLSDGDGGPSSNRTVRLAGTSHPGVSSLASTISTGDWPEVHGVIGQHQPHVDRLGYEIPRPERATGGSIWSAAAASGRHVAIGNWPHGWLRPELDGSGRHDRIEPRAIDGLAGEAPASCPPGAVEPKTVEDSLRGHGGADRIELNCAAIEVLADEGPDLMLGWISSISGDIGERRARIEGIRTRLGEAAGSEATMVVLEHPPVESTIFRQPLRNPPPLLHVFGPRVITIKGRPRVDVIPALVAEAIGVDPKSSRFRVDPPSGGVERLQAAGLPGPNRISAFDLKQYEFERSREIAASLIARGRWAEAEPWLSSSIQTQHGRIDVASLVLLLIRIRRARGAQEADRLLASVRERLSPVLGDLIDAWLAGRGGEVIGEGGTEVLRNLGPFLAESLLVDLRRRGRLPLPEDGRSG
ncbi:MAG: hypothetical protein CMJ34_04005 [Phycisphaerae bacterium]|nr:hypothetical protein [Phycisphaerae bacterium]